MFIKTGIFKGFLWKKIYGEIIETYVTLKWFLGIPNTKPEPYYTTFSQNNNRYSKERMCSKKNYDTNINLLFYFLYKL